MFILMFIEGSKPYLRNILSVLSDNASAYGVTANRRRHLGRQWDDVSEDMKRFGLSRENALSWRKWRRKTEAAFG